MRLTAFRGAAVFDGSRLLPDHALLVDGGIARPVPLTALPPDCDCRDLNGGTLMPGFVDLQVNGGGGVMFNDAPTPATLDTIAQAHRALGTRYLLPTLITDRPEATAAAISATAEAIASGVPGILGLHLEGPHLDVARKGAHDAALIREMTGADLDLLLRAADLLPNLLVTLAPESVSMAQIEALDRAGVIVFLGHSDTDYDTALLAQTAGARGVTHLFNAMSQLGSRSPGLVGAALDCGGLSAGLIADGIHVHPATIRRALAAKAGPGALFLVTDAMACAGSDIPGFTLNGRPVSRRNGRLELSDGTLAGADLSMAQALEVMMTDVGDAPEMALARATSIPAAILNAPGQAGQLPAPVGDVIYLAADFTVRGVEALS